MSWRTLRLCDVAEVGPRDPRLSEKAPFVPMASVEVGRRYPTYYEERGSRGGVRMRANDVLFARITPCLENGKVGQLPEDARPTGGSTEFIVVRPGPGVDPGYLYYWCRSPDVRDGAQRHMTGATGRMRFSGDDLGRFEIPLPPLDEQRRIVAILEDHLSRLDAAGAALETASRRARRLDVALIDEYCRESRDEHVCISELLAEPMRNGHSASASLTGEGIRTLTLTAVTRNEFSDRYTKLTKADERRVADLWLTAGDILVERANTPELVGTSALFAGPSNWAIFPDLLIRIRIHADRARPGFVAAALRSTDVRRFFRSRARGLAGSMPKIDQATVGAAAFPLPSLAAQDEFLHRLSEIESAGIRSGRAIDLATTRAASLRRSLLTAAFSGQLT